MRKISLDSATALVNNKGFKRDNTTVSDGVMRLYNNPIVWIEKGVLNLSDCGWQTVTTKDRLNAVLGVFNLGHIFQKDYEWFYSDQDGSITSFNSFMEVKL